MKNKLLLTLCLLGLKIGVFAQAPNIHYASPQTYNANTAITPLTPSNSGGVITSVVSTLAGSGAAGATNGTGTAARFSNPIGVATDASGNAYVADQFNHLIRKISPAGVVTTYAGSGAFGSANGTTATASFRYPTGVAVDASGNVFVADGYDNRIRKISTAGVVTTFAGSGAAGSADGTGTAATFHTPTGVATDAAGNVYVADLFNALIRKITPAGVVTTLAGNTHGGAANGTGAAAGFGGPYGLCLDASGNIYVADSGNNEIREVSPTGVVTTLAGNGATGSADGTGTAATFNYPQGVAIDASGNLFVSDTYNNTVRKITPAGVVTTVAGNGTEGSTNGAAASASFYQAIGIATDPSGNVFVADLNNNLVRKITIEGYSISPALPAGLSLDAATGIISGTPLLSSPATNYTVTATNTSGNSTTTVNIAVKLSSDATLSTLTPGTGSLSPSFAAQITNYTAAVSNATTSIMLTATTHSAYSTLTVNGAAVASGAASGSIALNVGSNTINTVVTAQDGTTTQTYTLTVTRAASAISTLANLVPSAGTMNSAFAPGTVNYTESVPNATSFITLTPTTSDATATITVNGTAVTNGSASNAIALNVGSNTINTVVTAQDGATTQTYTLTVTRAANSIATLANLVLSAGTMNSAFAPGTVNYTESVPNATSFITLTPTASDATAAITVNGTAVANGSASNAIALNVGSNTINTVVTAQDGSTTQTYTLTVMRAASSIATLAYLVPSAGAMNSAFAPGTTSYTESVPNATSFITLTPTTSDAMATITVNGIAVTNGSASNAIALSLGSNIISTVVTSQDGTTTQTYTLTVTRAASSLATLSSLVPSTGVLSPVFNPSTANYTVSVSNATAAITLTPSTSDPAAAVTINGAAVPSGSASNTIALNIGNNTINAVVTAQDGTTTQAYTLTVIRASNSLATLANLIPSSGTLSPAFAPSNTSYTVSVPNATTDIALTPTTGDAAATVTVNGTSVTNGSASGAINLNIGNNTITSVVTAQDGITTQTYTIIVTRAASSVATLTNLVPSTGTLSPVFASGTTSYTASVSNAISSITFTPTASVAATITVNGASVTNGSSSGAINLNVGNNTITTVVTAQDGITTQTYTIMMTRAASSVATVANLVPNTGTLSPAFASGTTSYTVSVPNTTSSITFTPTTSDAAATLTMNGAATISGSASGAINLNVGNNTMTAVVTAQDGVTTQTYSITVTRAASSVATLANLVSNTGPFSPAFTSGTTNYTATVPNATSSITLTPTTSDAAATATINGMAVAGGSASGAIALNVGNNAITTVVTAQDGTTTQAYTLNVTRAAAALVSNPNLDRVNNNNVVANAAYSLRQLKSSYTHTAITAPTTVSGFTNATTPLVRVRRATDNAQLDIGYTGAGDLDTATLKSFTGAGNGYVSIWYDQSGNSYDVVQADMGHQPLLVTNGTVERSGIMPAVRFINAQKTILQNNVPASTMFGSGYKGSVFPVMEGTSAPFTSSAFGYGGGTDRWQVHPIDGLVFDVGQPSNRVVVTNTTYAKIPKNYSFFADSALQQVYVSGALQGSASVALTPCTQTQFNIGGISNFDFYHEGHESEIIIYNSKISMTDQQTLEANQEAYYALLPVSIASFSPKEGVTGTAVTIQGSNFTGINKVMFGGMAATSFTINSPTSITAIVGAGATGSVSLVSATGTVSLGGFNYGSTLDKLNANVSAQAAYSLRQLKSNYTHTTITAPATVAGFTNATAPVIRVRRSADDALLDVGYTANGDLDTLTLKSFVSTGYGYVSIWYDQSGNSFDVAQTNAAQQPALVTNGNIERSGLQPAVRFSYAQKTVLKNNIPAAIMFGSGYIGSVFPVYEASAAGVTGSVFGYGDFTDRWQVHGNAGVTFDVGNPPNRVTMADNSLAGTIATYGFIAGVNQQQIYVNGSLKGSSTSALSACKQTQFNIGGIPNFDFYHDGHESEIIIYNCALSESDQQTVQTNQSGYYMAAGGATTMAITMQQPQAMETSVSLPFTSNGGSGTTTYALQKQNGSGTFSNIATISGKGTGNFTSADLDPMNGESYYKIQATDSKGNQAYSEVMRVSIANARGTSVAPNTILNKQVTVKFTKMKQGQYVYTMVSMSGNVVDKRTLLYDGDSPSVTFAAPASLHTGIYIITITSDGYKRSEKVVVE